MALNNNNNNNENNRHLLDHSSSIDPQQQQNDASSLSSATTAPLDNNNFYEVTRVDHQNKMSNELQKMFYNGKLCDVTIICNGKSVKAHQVVLAASSSYFKEIFHSNQPGSSPTVFIKNFTNEDLNDILEFVYNGQINIPCNRLESLVDSAKSLGIYGLAELRLNNNDPSLETNFNNIESQENVDSDNQTDLDSATLSSSNNTNSTTKRKRRKKKNERFSVYSPMKKAPKTDLENGIDSISKNNNHNINGNDNTNQCSIPALRPRSSMITKSTTNDLELNVSLSAGSSNTNMNKNFKKEPDNNSNTNTNTIYNVNGKILRNRNNNNNNTDNNNVKTNNQTNDSSTDMNGQNLDYSETNFDSNSSNNLIANIDGELNGKIIQSKIRSWKQQIEQKTPTSIISHNNFETASLENNDAHIKITPTNRLKFSDMLNPSMIKLEPRQRGRPKKIITEDDNYPKYQLVLNKKSISINGDKKINNVSITNNFGKNKNDRELNNQSQSKILNGSSTSVKEESTTN